MCGIVGGVSRNTIERTLLKCLERLEYRGYDSAGIAVLSDGNLVRRRTVGKVERLYDAMDSDPMPSGHVGIAHTRWATHGKPSECNAHPMTSSDQVAVVHNGILDNHAALREALTQAGYRFTSDTDTECIAHSCHQALHHVDASATLDTVADALRTTFQGYQGAFAIGLMDRAQPNTLWATCHESPLVIGAAEQGYFIASDPLALLGYAKHFVYLTCDQLAAIRVDGVTLWDAAGKPMQPQWHTLDVDWQAAELHGHRHFMHKEIHEQPYTLELLAQTYQPTLGQPSWLASDDLARCDALEWVACGSSYYAALMGQHWMEQWAGVPCRVHVASEYRYQRPLPTPSTLLVTLSQSGETADTLGALRLAKQHPYGGTLTLCNVTQSAMVRESDDHVPTLAGAEVGVASTKAFTAQLFCAMALAWQKRWMKVQAKQPVPELPFEDLPLTGLSASVQAVLDLEPTIQAMAHALNDFDQALFVGRGWAHMVALEGALKLKEITYINAQAYPAGELKHGPLALVDPHMPVVALVPDHRDPLSQKTLACCETILARDGRLFLCSDEGLVLPERFADFPLHHLKLPTLPTHHQPVAYAVALQCLAYHTAVIKGLDVDRPRNLAKSVTVE